MVKFDNTEIAFKSKKNSDLKRAYWLFKMMSHPWLVSLGKVLINIAVSLRIPIGWALKWNVFEHFCGGESINECAETTKVLDEHNIGTILDYSVEGKENELEFERGKEEILKTIAAANNNPNIPFCVFKITGLARMDLLEKVQSKESLSKGEAAEFQRVRKRVDEICNAISQTETPLFIDAEDSWIQGVIDNLVEEMMELYNQDRAVIYSTIQLYRWDRLDYLKSLLVKAKEKGYKIGMKLVRGAYMEKERDRAEEMGYPDPIQPDKESTDRDYNAAQVFCIENIDSISVCTGTHNELSSRMMTELMAEHGISKEDPRVYFAQLFGMSDHISFNLSELGYNVAKYVPYGPLKDVMPYLIRRAEENTSIKGQTTRELNLLQEEVSRRKGALVRT